MPSRPLPVMAACALAALAPMHAQAPAASDPHVIMLSAQASVVPLYGGDATVGRMTGVGPTVRIGAKLVDQMPFVEASYSFLGGNGATGKPRVQFFSVQVGRWFSRRPTRPSAFLGGGLGITNYSAGGIAGCVPPQCVAQGGGADFISRSVTGLVGDAGLALPVVSGMALRGDFRVHVPMERPTVQGASGKLRFELAFGLRLRASSVAGR